MEAFFVNVFLLPPGILANVKISHLLAFSLWLCDLFPSCVYFTRVLMNFLIISSISVKQSKIMEVHHDQDALLNFVWKCSSTVQLQCLLIL